jgi:hypothetical protein
MADLEDDAAAAAAAAKSTACAARANHRTTKGTRLDAMTNCVFFKDWNLHLEVLSQVNFPPLLWQQCNWLSTGVTCLFAMRFALAKLDWFTREDGGTYGPGAVYPLAGFPASAGS